MSLSDDELKKLRDIANGLRKNSAEWCPNWVSLISHGKGEQ